MSGFIGDTFKSVLGSGCYLVSQPVGGLFNNVIQGNERVVNRSVLRRSFGSLFNPGLNTSPLVYSNNNNSKCGSFRSAFNAGDINGTVNQATNIKYGREHNHVTGNNLARLNLHVDYLNTDGGAFYAGNPKFVYDASDFIKYKKLKAVINRNYNDLTVGGDQNSASQNAQRRMSM